MLKTALSALALAALMTGVATGGADAKKHHKKKAEMTHASCAASMGMRDETRFHACNVMPGQKK